MVIVTSRPVATTDIRRECTITKYIEVIGFSKEQIHEYIDKFPFSHPGSSEISRSENLKTFLEVHRNVLYMCYLPVLAAMICFLHQYSKAIPYTETKIYEEFTRLILLRYLRHTNKKANLPSLHRLPEKETEWFRKICQLAFNMCMQSKQVIYEDDTDVSLSPECSQGDECGLGLVTIDHTVAMFGSTNTYTFLHLTLQEYLAAYHIASREEDEQIKLLQEHGIEDHMSNVLVFYCGMSQFTEDDARLRVVKWCFCDSSSNGLRCAFESQQRVVCDSVVIGDGRIVIEDNYLTLVDISSMVYVISNISSHLQHLEITDCHMNVDKLKYFFESFASCKYSTLNRSDMLCKLASLKHLDLLSNFIGVEGVVVLVSGLNDANVHLHSLKLRNNDIGGEGARVLLDDLNCRQDIEVLDLSYNNIVGAVWGGLKYWTNLKTLYVIENTFDVSETTIDVVVLAEGLQNCKALEMIDLADNSIGADDAIILANGLKNCSALRVINI